MRPICLGRQTALAYHRNQRMRLAEGRIAQTASFVLGDDSPSSSEAPVQVRRARRRLLSKLANELDLPTPLQLCEPDRSATTFSHSATTFVDGTLPKHNLVDELAPGIFVCRPSLVLAQIAIETPCLEITRIACELCGTYTLDSSDEGFTTTTGLRCDLAEITADLELLCGLRTRGGRRALNAIQLACDRSASPLETNVYLMLTISRGNGGFGLPRPLLNSTVRLSGQGRKILGTGTIRPDLLWPDHMVAAEIDSTAWHVSTRAHNRDADRRAALHASGYDVFTITSAQAYDLEKLGLIVFEISKRLGIRRARPTRRMVSERRLLHERLFVPTVRRHDPMGTRCPDDAHGSRRPSRQSHSAQAPCEGKRV